jgi:hypothetical protein
MGWIKATAISALAIGVIFLALGILSVLAVYTDTSGAVQVPGTISRVVPPVDSVDSVHLVVQTNDGHGVLRVGTSSEDGADFLIGQPVTVLVKGGQEPELDDGSGRYTGSMVAIVGAVPPLIAGFALWRSRDRLARTPQS